MKLVLVKSFNILSVHRAFHVPLMRILKTLKFQKDSRKVFKDLVIWSCDKFVEFSASGLKKFSIKDFHLRESFVQICESIDHIVRTQDAYQITMQVLVSPFF